MRDAINFLRKRLNEKKAKIYEPERETEISGIEYCIRILEHEFELRQDHGR